MTREEKQLIHYQNTHKEIDGIIYKQCSICKEWFPENQDNFYKKGKEKLSPYCKTCESKKNSQWQKDNPDRVKAHNQNEYKKPHVRKYLYELSKRRLKNGEQRKWQQNNPDKLKQYREFREMNKTHTITNQEWKDCKKYFNNCCAYCGLPIEEHYFNRLGERKLGDFHKEHVDHEGANDLSNCVPSCKSCNSSKGTYILEEWYTEDTSRFSQERLDKIYKWLNEDYKLYLQEHKPKKKYTYKNKSLYER
jgi:hypothetical protein